MKTFQSISATKGFHHLLRAVGVSAFSCALTVSVGSVALADDTEIFFPPEGTDTIGLVRPNVLLVMDTSGSMQSNNDGLSKNRLERMKDSLQNLLTSMSSNVNVGLMRFSLEEGGPILFPISPIDAQVNAIETNEEGSCEIDDDDSDGVGDGGLSGLGYASVRIEDANDTAIQFVDSGSVVLSPSPVFAGGTLTGGGPPTDVVFAGPFTPREDDDDDEAGQGDNSVDLDLGERDVGIIFRNTGIPQGAFISNAYVEVSHRPENGTDNTEVRIFGVDEDDPDNNGNIYNYDRTEAFEDWDGPFDASSEPGTRFRSVNIASVIQEIVNRPDFAEDEIGLIFDAVRGKFPVFSRDTANRANRRPRLFVEYSESAPVSEPAIAALRFADLRIPRGVTLTNATLELTVADEESDLALISIYGEDVANSAAFAGTDDELANRLSANRTSASKDLETESDWTSEGSTQQIDVTSIVQEIVAGTGPGWCGGNAMTLFLEPRPANEATRRIVSSLTNPDVAPRLVIDYPDDDPNAVSGCNVRDATAAILENDDDGEERYSNGNVSLGGNVLNMDTDFVALRFQDLNVLRNAEIRNAYIELTASHGDSGTASFTLSAEMVANAPALGSNNGALRSRWSNRTTEVGWSSSNGLTNWSSGTTYATPNLKDAVQDVVNQANWRPGGAMVFFIDRQSGRRRAHTLEGSGREARLVIEYSGGVIDDTGPLGPTVRDRLRQIVDEFLAGSYTPIPEVMTEAALYYRGEKVFFGRTRGAADNVPPSLSTRSDANETRVSHCASYTGGTQINPSGCSNTDLNDDDCTNQYIQGSNPTYISPITASCQANYMVVLSDGWPNRVSHNDLIHEIIGETSCDGDDADIPSGEPSAAGSGCAIDLADFLASQDQADLDGTQTIKTYTISFGAADGAAYLADIADAGLGAAYTATTSEQLTQVFKEIFAEILDKNTTFVAPAVTINSFNRLTHLDQLYFALFQPSVDAYWRGNLKRFRLDGTADTGIRPYSPPGVEAVDTSTGFFKETVFSWWNDTTEADGGLVGLGGAAAELPTPGNRKLYTNLGGGTSLTEFTKANISADDLDLGSDEDLADHVIDWVRGIDVNDDDGDGENDDERFTFGDPLHSEPVLVTRGGSEDDPDITVFMGTNDGFIYGINGADGRELFGFIPDELLGNLKTLEANVAPWSSRPYGMDGPLVAVDDRSSGSQEVTLIAGMRRGGRSYYALDVTENTPTLNWSIKGGTDTGFDELGQSWSVPVLTTAGADERRVLIFSGGYDDTQDGGLSRPDDQMGRGIFMVDFESGNLLWSASFYGASFLIDEIDSSFPASPAVLDLDNDGIVDRLYALDAKGKVFRIDFDNTKNLGADGYASGGLFANLEGSGATGDRRFYNSPDVALVLPGEADPVLTISFGSGFRAHPLDNSINDRFYVLFDPDINPGDVTSFEEDTGPILPEQIYDASSNDLGSSDAEVRQAARETFLESRGAYIGMRNGEKVLTVSRTFDNQVVFATFQPGTQGSDVCKAGEGNARVYAVDVFGLTPAGDFDGDGDEDEDDRSKDLALAGIPPNPVILFPENEGGPIQPIVFVGPEGFRPDISVSAQKTTWEELTP